MYEILESLIAKDGGVSFYERSAVSMDGITHMQVKYTKDFKFWCASAYATPAWMIPTLTSKPSPYGTVYDVALVAEFNNAKEMREYNAVSEQELRDSIKYCHNMFVSRLHKQHPILSQHVIYSGMSWMPEPSLYATLASGKGKRMHIIANVEVKLDGTMVPINIYDQGNFDSLRGADIVQLRLS